MIYTKKLLLISSLLSITIHVSAQHKQYTMAEATNGIANSLAPKGIKAGQWRPGTHQFFYKDQFDRSTSYFPVNDDSNGTQKDPILSVAERYKNCSWLSKNSFYKYSNDTLYMESLEDKSGSRTSESASWKLPGNAKNLTVFGYSQFAYTLENNLYYGINSKDSYVQLTSDSDPDIINGQAVHRNEFGIDKGIFFSPKGNFIAYYRMDQTMVADYPVIDWSVVPAKNTNVKYPMAGGVSHQVTIQVYNIKTRETIALQTGTPKDHYLTCVTWSPDEKYIYLAILNRGQNHLWLNQYNARTGEKVKTIFEETDPKYVEPQHPLTFLPGSNTQFVWWSQRDGYMHLWLCDLVTNRMKCLTPGRYVVSDLLAINEKQKEILFTSGKEDPREKHGYAVNWKTGTIRRLDTEAGTHNYIASQDGAYLYDVLTGSGIPKKTLIRSISGKIVTVLMESPNPLADYERPKIMEKILKASDGTSLYGRLILPTNFDETKKYPVIVYLYNGPHVQQIKNGFPESGNLWYEYLAQHGYVVWTMDGRGSSNRGQKFEQAVFRKLGTIEMEDQMVGVNFLKTLPYVNAKRMGIHGWSFGGFMTTSFMLRKPDVFKVGVAGGPVMDWKMYEIMYSERYMDTPEENPKGYEDANLLTKTQNLKGKLLLIHGAQDATVVWQHSINFLKKTVDENVQVDYFVYPGYEHNVRGKDRIHLMQKITDYFNQNL